MVLAWQADTKDDLPADTKDIFYSSAKAEMKWLHVSSRMVWNSLRKCGTTVRIPVSLDKETPQMATKDEVGTVAGLCVYSWG
jgi:hypothetical protein